MVIKVTLNSVPKTRVLVNDQKRETISTVDIGLDAQNTSIGTPSDVDASIIEDNDTILYYDSTDKL